jgi:hypothetical protein
MINPLATRRHFPDRSRPPGFGRINQPLERQATAIVMMPICDIDSPSICFASR